VPTISEIIQQDKLLESDRRTEVHRSSGYLSYLYFPTHEKIALPLRAFRNYGIVKEHGLQAIRITLWQSKSCGGKRFLFCFRLV
jgi:hypothetical protein